MEYTTYFDEEVGFLPGGIRENTYIQSAAQKKTPGRGSKGVGN
jgi:hypothetical protein